MDIEINIDELGKQYDKIHSNSKYYESRSKEIPMLEMLSKYYPYRSRVLDAGCGFGLPVLKYFNDNGHVIYGTDISQKSLDVAKSFSPDAIVSRQDTADLKFKQNYFDLIICLHSIMHMPVNRQEKAINDFYNFLVPGGYVYISFATKDYTNQEEFAGIRPFDSHALPCFHTTPSKYINIFDGIGFEIIKSNNQKIENAEYDQYGNKKYNELFYVLARKPIPKYAIHFEMISHKIKFNNLQEFFEYEESLLTDTYDSKDWEDDLYIALSREYIFDRLVETWNKDLQEYSYYLFCDTKEKANDLLIFIEKETRLNESIKAANDHGFTTDIKIINCTDKLYDKSKILLERYRINEKQIS